MQQYTNEITPDLIASFKNPFSSERMTNANAFELDFLLSHIEEMKHRTLKNIWRFAVEGALTRDGGKIKQASGIHTYTMEDGSRSRGAMVGDYVVYPDGSRAKIVNGSGSNYTNGEGVPHALVGSQIDNGDMIISTPQNLALLCLWDNSEPLSDDFLAPVLQANEPGAAQ